MRPANDEHPASTVGPGGRASGLRRLGLVAGLALLLGCDSGSGQSGSAFVFLSVDLFTLDGSTGVSTLTSSIADRGATTVVCAVLRNNPKNPTVTVTTGLDNVVIQSYTVRLTRLDGGGVPGPFTFGTGVTVPAGTSNNTQTLPLVIVPAQSKREEPLLSLPGTVNGTAEVTFRGRDARGQRVDASGAVSLLFVRSGTDSVATCGGAVPRPSPSPSPSPSS